jgi:hypothetical protein
VAGMLFHIVRLWDSRSGASGSTYRLQIAERPLCIVPQLDRAERERFDRPAARTPSENWKRLCPLARRIASARVIRPIKRARQWTGRSELPTGSAPMCCWADRTGTGRLDERGYCEDTGEPIDLRRLEAQPTATLATEVQRSDSFTALLCRPG